MRARLLEEERDPARKARLFEPFGGPRAAVVRGLTDTILTMVAAEAPALKGASVLDYGCGVMPYATAFALAGAQVVGADIGDNPSAGITLSEVGDIPMGNGTFDMVTSFQVLEHVPDPGRHLSEAHRVLKPGGRILLTTHGLWPYHPTPTDHRRWTRDGLEEELRTAGFEVTASSHVLNEYSAALQFAVMAGEYRGTWRQARRLVHALAHCAILVLERTGRHEPQLPAVLCVRGVKH